MFKSHSFAIAFAFTTVLPLLSHAGLVVGNGVLSFNETASATATPVTSITGFFDNTSTSTQVVNDPGLPFNPNAINFGVNPASVTNPTGRTLQNTTLDFDPQNILSSWTAGNDVGAFVIGGEQIGFEGMTRWSGLFPGSLLFGDFALRYAPGRAGTNVGGNTLSGLVLTSNIDFADAAYADIVNATIGMNGGLLSITGDMAYSNGFATLTGDPNDIGVKFGTFSLNPTAVPEPSSALLSVLTISGFAFQRRRMQHGHLNNRDA